MISPRSAAQLLVIPAALTAGCASTGRAGRLENAVDALTRDVAGLTDTVERVADRALSERPFTFTRDKYKQEFAYLLTLALGAYQDKTASAAALLGANGVRVSPHGDGSYSILPVHDANGDGQTSAGVDRIFPDYEGPNRTEVTGFRVAPGFLKDDITSYLNNR